MIAIKLKSRRELNAMALRAKGLRAGSVEDLRCATRGQEGKFYSREIAFGILSKTLMLQSSSPKIYWRVRRRCAAWLGPSNATPR